MYLIYSISNFDLTLFATNNWNSTCVNQLWTNRLMWSVKCGVWRVECGVWSVECEMWSLECGLWSVKYEVWIVELVFHKTSTARSTLDNNRMSTTGRCSSYSAMNPTDTLSKMTRRDFKNKKGFTIMVI